MNNFLTGSDALDRLREVTRGKDRQDDAPRNDARHAHTEYVARQQNAWKPKAASAK